MGNAHGKDSSLHIPKSWFPWVVQELKDKTRSAFRDDVFLASQYGKQAGVTEQSIGSVTFTLLFRPGCTKDGNAGSRGWQRPGNSVVVVTKVGGGGGGGGGDYTRGDRGDGAGVRDEDPTFAGARMMGPRQFYYAFSLLKELHTLADDDAGLGELCPRADSTASDSGLDDSADDDDTCAICFDAKKEVVLPCTHSFCEACFTDWVAQAGQEASCPMCRQDLRKMDSSELWQLTEQDEDTMPMRIDLSKRLALFLGYMSDYDAKRWVSEDG